jgi:hypothetical protein
MNLLNQIYIDGKGYTELTDSLDKRIVLEATRMLQDYEDELEQYPEGKIDIIKSGSIEITGFPKELTKLIRNVLLDLG